MGKNQNPKLKKGDRIILVNMPGENLYTGTKGKVTDIGQAPTFGSEFDYLYEMEWYDKDEDNNVIIISVMSLLPEADSWLLDPEYRENNLNEVRKIKITDLDELISRHEWSKLFKKSDLKYIMEFLEVIRQLGVVNMFESSQFLGQTKDYIKKYFDLYRMQRELDGNDEELIEKITDMVENVRNVIISAAVTDLEQKNTEITSSSVTYRVKKLSTELLKHFMGG